MNTRPPAITRRVDHEDGLAENFRDIRILSSERYIFQVAFFFSLPINARVAGEIRQRVREIFV
jgi:hypothetical protein